MKKNWIGIPLVITAICMFISFLFKWKPSRWKIDAFALKIPVITDLLQYSNFANFIYKITKVMQKSQNLQRKLQIICIVFI